MTGLRLMPLTVLALLMLFAAVESKKFTRCALARELKKQGFPRSQLRNWVCLVEAESSRNTRAINKNTNGSKDYGLFQINDKYWCSHGKPGNDCNLKCSDLLKNDITVASRCAKVIYKRHKFYAWYGWKNHCRKRLPNISMCKV